MSLTIVARLLTTGELLGLEPVQDLLVHEPHVRVITDSSQLIIAVEVLGGADPAAHQAARLRGEARRLLKTVVQRKLKQVIIYISCSVIHTPQLEKMYCSVEKFYGDDINMTNHGMVNEE